MPALIFFEKPGCKGNANQQRLLKREGVDFLKRDLLSEHWSPEALRPFFDGMSVCDWFNPSSPRVTSGEVRIREVAEQEALALMIEDPLLIRRPLLQTGDLRQAGFEQGPVLDAIGVVVDGVGGLQSCPVRDGPTVCGDAP